MELSWIRADKSVLYYLVVISHRTSSGFQLMLSRTRLMENLGPLGTAGLGVK